MLSLLSLGLWLGSTSPVVDDPQGHPIEIDWAAPTECPDASWARREVERFVGDSLAETRATQLSFEVTIEAEPAEGWVASIVTITEGGRRRRSLPHSECERLSEAAALIIAMAIDPAAIDAADDSALGAIAQARVVDEPEPETAEPEPESTEPESMPSPKPEPTEAESTEPSPPSETPRGRLADRFVGPRIAFDAGVGRLPTVDLGGTAGAIGGLGPLRIELLAGAWAPRSVVVQDGATTRFSAWSIALRLGWAFAVGRRVELPVMAGVDLGQVRAEGRGLEAAARASPPIGHTHLVPGVVVWVLPTLGLLAEVDVAVPWARPEFTVDGAGTVFRALPVAVHGALGITARFPRRPSSR